MKKRLKSAVSVVMASAMLLAMLSGCSKTGSAGSSAGGSSANGTSGSLKGSVNEKKDFKFLSIWAQNTDNAQLITGLDKEYEAKHPNFKLDFEMVSSDDLMEKITTLQAANELPDAFAYESGKPLEKLIDEGALVNIGDAFKSAGIYDQLEPSAVSLLNKLVDNKGLYAIPLGMNIEGFWYNKKMFADNNISVPKTWDDLINDCKVLYSKNIQPIAVAGKDKWPATRLLSAYIMMSQGPDALQDAVVNKQSIDTPDFIKAAQVVQNMSTAGYFGKGVDTVDLATAVSMVLNNKAGMIYDGSWITQDLNNKTENALGPDGVGFFNVPLVTGGKGKATDYSVNCGNILALSKASYDASTQDWVKFVFSQFGDYAMAQQGVYKGFKINNMPSDVSGYTKLVGEQLDKVQGPSLWFEGSFDDQTTKIAEDSVQTLLLGTTSPSDYFKNINASLQSNED